MIFKALDGISRTFKGLEELKRGLKGPPRVSHGFIYLGCTRVTKRGCMEFGAQWLRFRVGDCCSGHSALI